MGRSKVRGHQRRQICYQNRRGCHPVSQIIFTSPHRKLKAFDSRQYLDQHKVAIVCSARSGSTKALGTTNLLLKAASQAIDRSSRTNGGVIGTPGTSTPSWAGGGTQTPSWAGSPRPFSSLPTTPGGPGSSHSPPPLFPSLNGSPSSSSAKHGFSETVDLIRKEHMTAARSLIGNKKILAELEGEIERDCEGLRSFLFAAQVMYFPRRSERS